MHKLKLMILLGLIVVLPMAYVYLNYFAHDDEPQFKSLTHLEKMGDECTTIAEKAAMNLPVALPFQRLEKQARQARVMETCMTDRGYVENPEWAHLAKALAKQQATQQQVSVDEAYETQKREEMYQLKPNGTHPLYWRLVKP